MTMLILVVVILLESALLAAFWPVQMICLTIELWSCLFFIFYICSDIVMFLNIFSFFVCKINLQYIVWNNSLAFIVQMLASHIPNSNPLTSAYILCSPIVTSPAFTVNYSTESVHKVKHENLNFNAVIVHMNLWSWCGLSDHRSVWQSSLDTVWPNNEWHT